MIPNQANGESERSRVVLRLHEDRWHALRGILSGGRLRIEEMKSFDISQTESAPIGLEPENGTTNTLVGWLESVGNPQVFAMIPAGLTISRVLDLMPEDGEDLNHALRLQAESHLLGGASAHRVGMASIPARNESINQGIVVTWPESSKFDVPLLADGPLCISETAALLAMVPTTPLDGPLLHVERATGSVALVLEHDDRLLVRSTREQDSNDGQWRDAVTRAVVETAVTDHQSTEQVEHLRDTVQSALEGREELLLLPESVRAHLKTLVVGAGDDDWWNEWGLCVGALLATDGPFKTLTALSTRKPTETGGTLGELSRSLSRPQTVAAIVVAAFVVIALLPLVAAWLRLSIVESKVDDQAALEQTLTMTDQRKAVYNEIAQRSWPMTKLLGDFANCIPLGIDADQITINEGDSINMHGAAGSYGGKTPKELLQEMQLHLSEVGLFDTWKLSEEPINSGGKISFTIDLPIKKPFKYVRNFKEDFAEKTHGQRRYADAYAKIEAFNAEQAEDDGEIVEMGEDDTQETTTTVARAETSSSRSLAAPSRNSTSRSASSSATNDDERSTPPGVGRESLLGVRGGSSNRRNSSSSSSRSSTISGSTGSATRRSEGSGAVSSGGPAPVPEEFSDTELASLSKPEAKELLERIAKAKLRKDLDEATADRLRTDLYRVLDHMKTIPDPGDSG